MPPPLALCITLGVLLYLLRLDTQWRKAGSSIGTAAAWAFLAVICSRPLSYWLGSGGGPNGEGNPVNTAFYAILIFVSVVLLCSRQVRWSGLFASNAGLFVLYSAIAILSLFSEDPTTALKRLGKDFTCVLIALVIVTDNSPALNFRLIAARVAYVLFPLSLAFGKYFPSIGRNFSIGGEPMFTGVTTQKNSLGEMVFVLSIILLWDLSAILSERTRPFRWRQVAARAFVLLLGVWLLIASDSKTSLLCLVIGAGVFAVRSPLNRHRHGKTIFSASLVLGIILAAMDSTLGLSAVVAKTLNRDVTLTGRTDIWRVVLDQKTDPITGNGFYLFWDGEKGEAVAQALTGLNSAHNGYLETYIDGGVIGCVALGILLLMAAQRTLTDYFSSNHFSEIGAPIFICSLIYNMSESSFLRLDPLWFALILTVVRPAGFQFATQSTRVSERSGLATSPRTVWTG